MVFMPRLWAQDTIHLHNDSLLIAADRQINFMGDTTVIIGKNGKVLAGNLIYNTYLWTGRRLLPFKGKSRVVFNKAGNIISGYLCENQNLWTATKQKIIVSKDSKTVFNDDGSILSCKLLTNQNIYIQDKRRLLKGGTYIFFYKNGNIRKAIFAKKEQLLNSLDKTITCKPNIYVHFNHENKVVMMQGKHK